MVNLKILHLESVSADAALVKSELKKARLAFKKLDVDNKADYIKVLNEFEPDVILCSDGVPAFSATEALTLLKKTGLTIPFILVTAPAAKEFAVNAIKNGAADYILKDRMLRLPRAILNAVEKEHLEEARQKHLKNLIENQTLLAEMESAAKIGSLDINLITQARKWSAGVDCILGYKTGQSAPSFEDFVQRIHPEDISRFDLEFNYAIANLDAINIEYRIITPAGVVKYVHTELQISRDKFGVPVRAHGFLKDETEKKVSQLKLDQANLEVSTLFNTIDDVFFSRDMTTNKLIQISPGCQKMYGYTQQEFLNVPNLWQQIIHPDNVDSTKDNYGRFALGETVITTYKIIHKDKGIRWAESKIIPTINEAGKLVRLDGTTRDITDRKLLELELQQTEIRLHSLIENSGDIISINNVDGEIIYTSDNIKKILGYSKDEYNIARLSKDFVHPADRAVREKLFIKTRQNPDKVFHFIYRCKHALGHWLWMEGTLTNLLHVPAVRGIVGNYRDISDRKIAEQLIQKNNKQLQQALRKQTAILNALPPQIALLDEDGVIVGINESWKIFSIENGLKTNDYGIGKNYVAISRAATGEEEDNGKAAAQGITDVISGAIKGYSMEYNCHSPSEKRWYQLVVSPLVDSVKKGAVVLHVNITDRKQAEDGLLQSEQRYRRIAETAQEGIWVIDENLTTTYVNKKLCDMLEYSADEIIGKHNYDFKAKNERLKSLYRIEKRKLGMIETHESIFITKSGKRIICIVSTNGIFDSDGTYVGTLAMVTDITERKAQEVALKKSEANLSAIIENTTDLVYSLDRELRFITYNELFKNNIQQVYGVTVEQNSNAFKLLSSLGAEAQAKWRTIYKKALAGEQQQFVNEYTNGDAKIYLSYSVNPIWQGGKVIGLSCFSRDITRQKLDEVALIKSEANLRSVFENTDLSIILFNTDFEIVSFNSNANKQAIGSFGKKLKTGRSGFNYFSKKSWPVIKNAIKKVKDKEVVVYETVYNLEDGRIEWFEVKWMSVLNHIDDVVGITLTFKNITANKNAQLERERMTTDLIRRNQDLEQFTYIISHNLRAPVANIKGLTELLHEAELPDENDTVMLGALSSSVNQLDKVIIDLNSILEVGKQINDKKENVDIEQLIKEIGLEIKLMAEKKQLVLTCDFSQISQIFTIRSYIYSIFQNLITNSIKYRRNNVNPVIDIKTSLSDKGVVIHFEDNGKGIDLKKAGEHLFGLYKRFDFTVEGKGMGLFMVKKQVQSLGGAIEVQSETGKGTKFLIELPL